jgi:hypothetical protein
VPSSLQNLISDVPRKPTRHLIIGQPNRQIRTDRSATLLAWIPFLGVLQTSGLHRYLSIHQAIEVPTALTSADPSFQASAYSTSHHNGDRCGRRALGGSDITLRRYMGESQQRVQTIWPADRTYSFSSFVLARLRIWMLCSVERLAVSWH